MSAKLTRPDSVDRITLDDVKQRAERVRDLAESDAREAVGRVLTEDATRTLIIIAGVVIVTASVAYMLGSRCCRRSDI